MAYYINCIKTHTELNRDIKELIPSMNIRRRMGALQKMGVTTALDSILDFEAYGNIDAIITSTWLGCISDSEKFLANLIDSEERTLNPTPFIQSTSNVIGGQLAMIRQLHVYNNTFVDRKGAFEAALIDAILQIECNQTQNVLVGVFDELTPSAKIILERLAYGKRKELSEGAVFFVLSKEKYSCSVAEIAIKSDDNLSENTKFVAQECDKIWCGSIAELMYKLILSKSEEVTLKGDTDLCLHLKCL